MIRSVMIDLPFCKKPSRSGTNQPYGQGFYEQKAILLKLFAIWICPVAHETRPKKVKQTENQMSDSKS